MALLGSLVHVKPEMNRHRHFSHSLGIQFEICRSVVNRIAAENNEHPHAAAVDVGYQLAQLLDLQFVSIRRKRLDKCNSLADIS